MCRTPNAAIYRECERKSSRSLVSYWTFAPRCAALLWPPGEIHGAETRLSGIPGRTPVGILKERRLVREGIRRDRKSTRLNSSHSQISYAVFCLKKKKNAMHNKKFKHFNSHPRFY